MKPDKIKNTDIILKTEEFTNTNNLLIQLLYFTFFRTLY